MSQAHPLTAYLEASGESLPAFAARIGVSEEKLAGFISGSETLNLKIARRIAAATGGAVSLEDMCSDSGVVEIHGRRTTGSVDVERLASVLMQTAAARSDTEIREPERKTIALAAEAIAHTYDALAGITTRHGPDRLQQALLPVLEETLKDYSGRAPNQTRLQEAAAEIARLYYQL